MDLSDVSVLVLTKDEEANIARTLSALTWAAEVIVVDSGSSDATGALAADFDNCRFMQRRFTTHAEQ